MSSIFPVAYIDATIETFKELVQIPAYDDVLEALIRKAFEQNIRVGAFEIEASRFEESRGGVLDLLIKKKPKFYSIREVIFDIMHELGHALDPIKLAPDRSNEREREERAWAFADQQFDSFPELQGDKVEYGAYKGACLATYPKYT
jgi:hypothetical protein